MKKADPIVVEQPNLLFLSPIVPSDSGNGPAMRAAMFLRALTPHFRVFLQVIPVLGTPTVRSDPANLFARCANVHIQSLHGSEDPVFRMIAGIRDQRHRLAALAGYKQPALCRFASASAIEAIQSRYADVNFTAIHVFRLYLAPFAEPFLASNDNRPVTAHLDLDDYESRTHARFATLHDANQQPGAAYLERAEANKYEALENTWLPKFDAVYICSEDDQIALAQRYQSGRFVYVPNAVSIPNAPPVKSHTDNLTLLFVGTLNYFPNEDAVLYFCQEILPLLRSMMEPTIRFVIAGAAPSQRILDLSGTNGVEVISNISDLTPIYHEADLVVVPIRAGGGTRIKILEAFAHRRPVVATTLAAEGIAARSDEHLLIADTADDFAHACQRLLCEANTRNALVENAYALVRSHYSLDTVTARIAQL